MGERCNRTAEVSGSIPLSSTRFHNGRISLPKFDILTECSGVKLLTGGEAWRCSEIVGSILVQPGMLHLAAVECSGDSLDQFARRLG